MNLASLFLFIPRECKYNFDLLCKIGPLEGKNTLNKLLGPCLGSFPGCSKSRVNAWQSRGLLGPILMCGLVLVRVWSRPFSIYG